MLMQINYGTYCKKVSQEGKERWKVTQSQKKIYKQNKNTPSEHIFCQPTDKFTLHNGSNTTSCASLSHIHTPQSSASTAQKSQPIISSSLYRVTFNWEWKHPLLERG